MDKYNHFLYKMTRTNWNLSNFHLNANIWREIIAEYGDFKAIFQIEMIFFLFAILFSKPTNKDEQFFSDHSFIAAGFFLKRKTYISIDTAKWPTVESYFKMKCWVGWVTWPGVSYNITTWQKKSGLIRFQRSTTAIYTFGNFVVVKRLFVSMNSNMVCWSAKKSTCQLSYAEQHRQLTL